MEVKFRNLKAEEIEIRVQRVNQDSSVVLLAYKDARCDMNILDATVGTMNWQREHPRGNQNCTVSIRNNDTGEWIAKEDAGVESNVEKEKGLASDSFKRACVNWGIGRELYTAPDIRIPPELCNVKNGKCYDKFYVQKIATYNKKIVSLIVYNATKNCVAFSKDSFVNMAAMKQLRKTIEKKAAEAQKPVEDLERAVLARYNITDFTGMTFLCWQNAMRNLGVEI